MARLSFLLVCAAALPVYAAAPSLEGLYAVGSLGLVEFSNEQGAIVGRFRGGGQCGFEQDLIVLSNGAFEEDVFFGQVLLCQDERQGCSRRKTFPLLGFFREYAGAPEVVAWVRFEGGCSSKAADEGRLLFRRATDSERASLTPPTRSRELGEHLKAELALGSDQLEQGSYTAARDHFRIALTYDATNLAALVGVGTAQVKLGEYRGAIESLTDASRRARESQSTALLGMAQYHLACAYARQGQSRESLAALSEAVRCVGGSVADALLSDRDLESVRATPEYRKLASRARAMRKTPK
jgi:tetratricopeptide (TPR) repeat protein